MSSTQHWLSDALRDPALAGAASVLLQAMDATGGSSSPRLATADDGGAPPPVRKAQQRQPHLEEVLSVGSKIEPAAAGAVFNGCTPALLLADGGSSAPPSPATSQRLEVPAAANAKAAAPEPGRGWIARSECRSTVDGGDGGRRRKRAPSLGGNEQEQGQRGGKRGRVVEKVISIAGTTQSSISREENSLQEFFSSFLSSRGYSATTLKSSQCGYRIRPTPLQRASYGTAVLTAVRRSDASTLRSLLTAGLSPNPCTGFSEDVLHMTCKRGERALVRAQLEAGADVRIADDLGRTPLHHAAWAGHLTDYGVVGMLLDREPDLLRVADEGGRTPLDFVRTPKEKEAWRAFLTSRADRYWPPRTPQGANLDLAGPSVVDRPGRVLQDPEGVLPIELAEMVASGGVSVEKVARMRNSSAVGAVPTTIDKPNSVSTSRPVGSMFTQREEQDVDYFDGARMFVNRMA